MKTSFKETQLDSLIFAKNNIERIFCEINKSKIDMEIVNSNVETLIKNLEHFSTSVNDEMDKYFYKSQINHLQNEPKNFYTGEFNKEYLEGIRYGIDDALQTHNEFVNKFHNWTGNEFEKMDEEKYLIEYCLERSFQYAWVYVQILKINITPQLTFNF